MRIKFKRNKLKPEHLYDRIESCMLEGELEFISDAFIMEVKLHEIEDVFLMLIEKIAELKHHKDSTCGLWATDRPDLISDPKKIMFEIKY